MRSPKEQVRIVKLLVEKVTATPGGVEEYRGRVVVA